jgi:transcriptional regulator with XRE-family HTH domain
MPDFMAIFALMALSGEEKAVRRELLAISVHTLRKRLGKTQAQFAAMLDDDAMTISRWERKVLAPRPRTQKKLSRVAFQHGWADLGAAFDAPVENWRSILLSPKERQLLALFEIFLLNKPTNRYQVPQVIRADKTIRLMRSVDLMVHELKRMARARKPVALIGPEQAAAWSALTDPRARELFERDSDPDLIVPAGTDQIEVVRKSGSNAKKK